MNIIFKEVSTDNSEKYLGRILKLQEDVYQNLVSQGKGNLFFKSSPEEICEYIDSKNSLVTVLEFEGNILSVCYFTFNHTPYNDLTLYIKNSKLYRDYVFETYDTATLISIYMTHLHRYLNLKSTGTITGTTVNLIKEKVKNNDFFENDGLRQKIADQLIHYDILNDPVYPWITSKDLPIKFHSELRDMATEFDNFISYFEYKYITPPSILTPELAKLSDPMVGELDTYFSAPNCRNRGYASTLIELSVQKALSENKISALSATVHPDNYISNHILQNLGFSKFCTVERRKDVPRNVMFKLLG